MSGRGQAALDSQKTREWIDRSTEKTTLATTNPKQPLEHDAFCQTVEMGSLRYAQVFLFDDARDAAVAGTFNCERTRPSNRANTSTAPSS
ncbi:hypothetical protein ACH4LK_36275 [Streptomyces lydicus]|uniref:hypothetical protein n=1 Tax=Streptomyces lydicus TaxID=47763 RepID=UPI0037BCB685